MLMRGDDANKWLVTTDRVLGVITNMCPLGAHSNDLGGGGEEEGSLTWYPGRYELPDVASTTDTGELGKRWNLLLSGFPVISIK